MPLGFSILFFILSSVCVRVSQRSKPLLVSTTSSALEFLSSVRSFLSRNGAFRELSLVAGRNLHETASASVIGKKNCGGAVGGEAGLGLAETRDEEATCMANPVKAAVQTRAEASASSEDDESDIDFRVRDPIHQCPSLCQILEELKELMGIACPMAAMNCVVYVRAMVSVLCLGRLGGLELAGGALSIGFTNITGYSVLFGLATGMDPVCSQAFGSKNWEVIGHTLQRTILILLTACIPISLLWINLQEILLQLGQDSEITKVATIYCLYSLPDLLTNSLLQPLRVYLRSQGITTPMMCCSALAVLLHIPLNIILVFVFKLGVPGVAMAAVCTNLNMVFLLLGYLWFSGVYKRTWVRWSMACFQEWWPLLSLAVPNCLAICLEWWWYELMTFLAGLLPNPQVAVATAAILIQTTSLLYTFPLALSSSVSTRVGNELGANRPAQARIATFVALGCALVIAFLSLVWSTAFRNKWGHLFTEDKSVLALTAAAMPLMGLCELGNCPQTTGCGVLRGSARPAIAARINLGSFYFVGMTVAVVLAFWFKIGFGGLWYGLLAAQIACACSTLFVVLRTDWGSEAERAKQLTGPNDNDIELCKGSSNKVVPILNDDRGDECLMPKQFSGLDCKVELCQSDIAAMTIDDDDDDDDDDDEADPLLTQTRTANVHRKKVIIDVHNSPPWPFSDRHKN